MIAQRLRYRVGEFLKKYFPAPENLEIDGLKQELKELKEGLQAVQWGEVNSVRREIESLRTDLQDADDKDLCPNEAGNRHPP